MKIFKDAAGREWRIKLTIGAIDRVLDVCGVDLLDPLDTDDKGVSLITRVRTDMRLLGKILAELIETDGPRELTATELREAFDGATKRAAWEALSAEWAGFFRQDGRADIADALSRHEELIQAMVRQSQAAIAEINPEREIAYADESGSLPALSASTRRR